MQVVGTSALPGEGNATIGSEAGLAGLDAQSEQQLGVSSEPLKSAEEKRVAGNVALLEAEEALEQGKVGLASARLLVAR
jgi:hypothetical protein